MKRYITVNGEITKEEYDQLMKDNDKYLNSDNIYDLLKCKFVFIYDDEHKEKLEMQE